MSPRARMAALAAAALLFGCAVAALMQADQARAAVKQDYMYLPNKAILKHFSVGMDSIIANLLWLECVQYTGRSLRGSHDYTWIEHMVRTATSLDPHFVELYRYGGMFLASLKGDGDAAIELLEEGIRHNPHAWELPYEIAMVYMLNRGEDPNSRGHALYYTGLSLASGNAPGFVQLLYDGIKEQYDTQSNDPCENLDFEEQTYKRLFETGEQVMQDVARQKMENLRLRRICCELTGIVRRYEQREGKPAQSLEALIDAGFLGDLSALPGKGRYFLDADGRVKNTVVLDEQVEKYKERIRGAIENYRKKFGEFPPTLESLLKEHALTYLPPHPYASRNWEYNPETGELK